MIMAERKKPKTGDPNKTKTCPKCGQEKRQSSFYRYRDNSRKAYRVSNYCISCARSNSCKRAKTYYRQHREVRLDYARDYRRSNRSMLRMKKRKYKARHIQRLQRCYLADQAAQRLGISQSQVTDEQIEEQRQRIESVRRKRIAHLPEQERQDYERYRRQLAEATSNEDRKFFRAALAKLERQARQIRERKEKGSYGHG